MTAMDNTLEFIRSDEGGPGPKGYGTVYIGAKGVNRKTDVSKLRLIDVLKFQAQMKAAGSRSTAVGGYQFLRATLVATISQMNLNVAEIWTPSLQDRMAIHLMRGRGLDKYLKGNITAEQFANNLAMEWASLPVVTAIPGHVKIGGKRIMLKPGQSYYAGDGLNKARHDPVKFLSLVKSLRGSGEDVREEVSPVTTSTDASKIEAPHTSPVMSSSSSPAGFWGWMKSWFN